MKSIFVVGSIAVLLVSLLTIFLFPIKHSAETIDINSGRRVDDPTLNTIIDLAPITAFNKDVYQSSYRIQLKPTNSDVENYVRNYPEKIKKDDQGRMRLGWGSNSWNGKEWVEISNNTFVWSYWLIIDVIPGTILAFIMYYLKTFFKRSTE